MCWVGTHTKGQTLPGTQSSVRLMDGLACRIFFISEQQVVRWQSTPSGLEERLHQQRELLLSLVNLKAMQHTETLTRLCLVIFNLRQRPENSAMQFRATR